jgi:Gluconate 2-dehydrogenase subunit 3
VKLSRRHLLALASLCALAGGAGVATEWWRTDPAPGRTFLDDDEAALLRALAGAAWPAVDGLPGGDEMALDQFFDALMRSVPQLPRDLMRVLMHALDAWPTPLHLSDYVGMPVAQRQAVLQGWLDHPLLEVRSAVQSLVILLGMGWSRHPAVSMRLSLLSNCGLGG